jgi:hypothetical protein
MANDGLQPSTAAFRMAGSGLMALVSAVAGDGGFELQFIAFFAVCDNASPPKIGISTPSNPVDLIFRAGVVPSVT